MAAAKDVGQWGSLFDLENIAVHASLLPTGKIFYWGRRTNPKDSDPNSLNEHFTKAFIWDPSTGNSKATSSQPFNTKGETVNLFCAGHCLQPDGSLLIVGGHISDGNGLDQACVYDPFLDQFSAKAPMNAGRWYPSALTLSDGSVLSISGNISNTLSINPKPQIWHTDNWVPVQSPSVLSLYPRLHLDPSGRVFMAGPQAQSQFLDVNNPGSMSAWTTDGPVRAAGSREYAPSVMYSSGKIMYIGGGGGDNDPPTKQTEIIDLNVPDPKWSPAPDLGFARRQHNATVLPDGSVLVTGGTQGKGFNNLDPGNPVHVPELWRPDSNQWSKMATEDTDRCYHAIALLLPDGRVLSAGSGEFAGAGGNPNAPEDSHKSAQLFQPPYLFDDNGLAPRPAIIDSPAEISYGQTFEVTVGTNDVIKTVSWIRLGSVTHACNMNQLLNFLDFESNGPKINIKAPVNANIAPPGHYMLFVLNQQGVPSVAPIVQIKSTSVAAIAPPPPKDTTAFVKRTAVEKHADVSLLAHNEKVISEQERPAVVVGLTPVCPYGLGPCWGGAFEALHQISDVEVVRPMPNQADSVAFVYLRQDIVPDIDLWRSEFQKTARGAYVVRGIEITLSGAVTKKQFGSVEQLILTGPSTRPELILEPFQETSKIEWDRVANAPKPRSDAEASAYSQLLVVVIEHPGVAVQVTGRLQKDDANKFSLEVRQFEKATAAASSSG